jgi:transcriptional regulator with XRE-family HTH domain
MNVRNRIAASEQGPTVPAPTSLITLPYLRAWRLSRDLTQAKLATAAHVSEPTVVRAERGELVGMLTATRLARALGVSVEQLQTEKPS